MKNHLFQNMNIKETNNFILMQDWEVPIPGFFIITAKKTTKSIDEFSEDESIELIKLLTKTRRLMKEVLNIEEIYIFQNEDTRHNFHIWLFPRYDWMKKFGKSVESVRVIINYAKENLTDEENIKQVNEYYNKAKKQMNND